MQQGRPSRCAVCLVGVRPSAPSIRSVFHCFLLGGQPRRAWRAPGPCSPDGGGARVPVRCQTPESFSGEPGDSGAGRWTGSCTSLWRAGRSCLRSASRTPRCGPPLRASSAAARSWEQDPAREELLAGSHEADSPPGRRRRGGGYGAKAQVPKGHVPSRDPGKSEPVPAPSGHPRLLARYGAPPTSAPITETPCLPLTLSAARSESSVVPPGPPRLHRGSSPPAGPGSRCRVPPTTLGTRSQAPELRTQASPRECPSAGPGPSRSHQPPHAPVAHTPTR